MDSESNDSSSKGPTQESSDKATVPDVTRQDISANESASSFSTPVISSWARHLKFPQPVGPGDVSQTEDAGGTAFSRLVREFGFQLPGKASAQTVDSSTDAQQGVFGSLRRGLVDSSLNAVKAVQVKARHIVSQNKRRYQEGGFDLDMTYITENVIAMGFPAGDLSSGFFGYFEGFYRNHMEEVIKFFETHHKDKYKVYNLCLERLYDASLFEGKVASFPFEDHNCPPIGLISLFCQSAYSWLKEDIQNVVVVHCKAGMARTGLMITSLILFLKFFPTAKECIDYYNQKRCIDGKGLVLPSQIRYVHYFERILTDFNGGTPPGRRCMLRGFRLHNCPYWIRPSITISDHNGILFSTKKHPKIKDLMPEDFWLRAARKGIVVFALPGEPGLTEVVGDFKIYFHDRQGDFYCWLNTTMMENRLILNQSDLDGFDKRKLPSPGFQVEIVMIDYDGSFPMKKKMDDSGRDRNTPSRSNEEAEEPITPNKSKAIENQENDDVFTDSDGEESPPSQNREKSELATTSETKPPLVHNESATTKLMGVLTQGTQQLSLHKQQPEKTPPPPSSNESSQAAKLDSGVGMSDIKAIAADASVFSFGDEEDEDI
ncbi:phosphatidylinositol 3,4,5-trisphosphate 3-phosphatase and protein-tyrosine-phosphatase PTEN2A-like [Impatiens glandulifera]|uniref:phosphatidylinositol 3,4,5-trisphosphate 3-phosphatase and protein-tyrosine-phosphatase PTEN2A-like n=1 Tax=Impatiens glandulifera TaxID=253017 RepID=UPI001FB0C4FB|nr:phosphatidylinositol 3,4,5-trisphosphate 3-phosphatase and protein-tyrosine-phosphatase PTEN2A-like [Impatiens glandulifera]